MSKLLIRLSTVLLAAAACAPAGAQLLPRILDRIHDAGHALRDHVRHGRVHLHVRHVHTDRCRHWIPPRCDTITERVWVPGRCERVWVPPVHRETCDSRGRRHRTVVRAGHWRTIQHPGHWESRTREVHTPGRWEYVCGH